MKEAGQPRGWELGPELAKYAKYGCQPPPEEEDDGISYLFHLVVRIADGPDCR
jgi:hypothetical protein